jgi:hypothetical protein
MPTKITANMRGTVKITFMAMALLAGLGLTACGTSTPASAPAKDPATSAPAATSAPVTGTVAANDLVCTHYLKQRAWVKNLVQPTLADIMQFEIDLAADMAESTGSLHHDLNAMLAAVKAGKSDYTPSKWVYDDCTSG